MQELQSMEINSSTMSLMRMVSWSSRVGVAWTLISQLPVTQSSLWTIIFVRMAKMVKDSRWLNWKRCQWFLKVVVSSWYSQSSRLSSKRRRSHVSCHEAQHSRPRVMKPELVKLNITISVIAHEVKKTPILRANRELHSIEEWVTRMKRYVVATNTVDSNGLAISYLINCKYESEWHGFPNYPWESNCRTWKRIARTRKLWMGEEMLRLFRIRTNAPLFSRIQVWNHDLT